MSCHNKILRLFFLLILFLCNNSYGSAISSINHIDSLKDPQVQAVFAKASNKHLYLFDVDFTLLTPSNPLLELRAAKRHGAYLSQIKQKMSDFEKEIFSHLWVMESPLLLTEPQWPALIKQAQDKGATTLGFTAAKTGSVGANVPDFPAVRYASLKQHGIDFHKYHPELYLFEDLDDFGPDKPGISQGIVYAGHKCKKDKEVIDSLLKFLLAKDKHKFTEIVMFEDRLEILENLQKFINENYPHINFIGMHYNFCSNLVDNDSNLEAYQALIDSMHLRALHIVHNQN